MQSTPMKYRAEIDGLRALAVIPVVFFHAGFKEFSGGYVGVDVFFVISGYLITTIILNELAAGTFSLIHFYERRARRILPPLFLIMFMSSIFAYAWMMPEEFKNFGQSLVATSLFSNNILLAITSGYWDLASEFNPLLHTWSLGVEEQYYVIFPFFLIFSWRHFRRNIVILIMGIAIISLLLANWGLVSNPVVTFYILPTRAWEILLGALAAFSLSKSQINPNKKIRNQCLSFLGFSLIFFSILFFNQNYPSPGFYILIPTLGALLIIIYAVQETLVNIFLSSRVMVGIGLISYSFYLWHQPLFAFSRIYLAKQPTQNLFIFLIAISFILAYLTWRFIEKPFRNKKFISRSNILYSSILISILFICFGYYLNKSYGMAYRVFNSNIEDMDKRVYNEKVFTLKKDNFTFPKKLKILIVGDSFGRDFVNMTQETFDMRNVDIIYRDDLEDCIFPHKNTRSEALYGSANIIVFSYSGGFNKNCVNGDISFAKSHNKSLFYIGTKNFGYNLNWIIRLDKEKRPNQYNSLLNETINQELDLSASVPKENFISLLLPIIKNNQIPITDNFGNMLSTDRVHLTKYGAIFLGKSVLLKTQYGALLLNTLNY